MLASTVQFSTNDQPTTPTKTHQHRVTATGMSFQVMPGIEKQPTRIIGPRGSQASRAPNIPRKGAGIWLFFQIPNRVLFLSPSPAASFTGFPCPPIPKHRAGCTHVKDRCRFELASVSAYEHPGSAFANRGLLTCFRR
jgi:hypothetical protein